MTEQVVAAGLRRLLADPVTFAQALFPTRRPRRYQVTPMRAVATAVVARARGDRDHPADFGIVFARQSGKDEALAQLIAYLLTLFQRAGGSVVVALPTLRPQGMLARDRLVERLTGERARALGLRPRVQDGTIVRVGRAACHFVSAGPQSNARGQTASLLLVANECQDILADRWDSVFAPMAASTDAVTLYLGTVWTADTLLARQMRHLAALEAADGRQRLFRVPWEVVARELPSYGRYVERQIALLGADHPFIRTEYELRELDGQGGLFPPSRQEQMQGDHPPLTRAVPGEEYALLLDVAGEEEEPGDPGRGYDPAARRDSTALTVVRVVRPAPGDAAGGAHPRYEVVRRYLWTGVKHTALHAQIVDLARHVWRARHVVVDATGVGAGLTSFLRASLGDRVVLPFVFSLASKSQLGWSFLAAVDSGRFKDHAPTPADPEAHALAALFWRQVRACTYAVRPGPNRVMSWSVPDPRTHDDLLISAALCAVLDEQDWRPRHARGR
ncbi:MAG: hypothetical protein QJR03_10015 [Sphaerobacter sp.]|nr:hypothetical protein [Sphaerobacter sp.]